MEYQDRAVSVWLGRGRSADAALLEQWRSAPLTYSPGQEIDHNWNVDRYEIWLGEDESGSLFRRAAELTLTNRFYPEEVMVTESDFQNEQRFVHKGDRVLQRIRIFQVNDLPVLEVLTMNEITDVIQEERRAGFTYTTTSAHSEIGEWSPVVEWREDGKVFLVINVVSRARPGAPEWSRRFTRKMQLRAHKRSIDNFLALLNHESQRAASRFAAVPADLLPVGLFGLAALLLITFTIGVARRQR